MLSVLIACSAAVALYAGILFFWSSSPKVQTQMRLDKLAKNVENEYIHDAVLNEKKKSRKTKQRKKLRLGQHFEASLAGAGIRLSGQEYLTIWAVLTLAPALLGGLLGVHAIALAGMSIVGFAIPPVMVQRAKGKRKQLFNKQLGDALTIMSNCMRSGYSFQQAMGSIAREMQPPISLEFARVIREINYGATMETALNSMVARVDNKDLELLVSAVITSTQVGANLSEILDTIAETVRDRIRIREEVRVMSAQGRMSGMIIGLLPVVVILFLMITNPSYFSDFAAHPLGKIMIAVSACMELIGFALINKIVDIKY